MRAQDLTMAKTVAKISVPTWGQGVNSVKVM
jgi:hypothetical protein